MKSGTSIQWFDSPEQYAEYCDAIPDELRANEWSGFAGMSYDSAVQVLRSGNNANMSAAEKLIAEMQDQQIFASGLPLPRASLVGSQPRIAAVLTGHPKSMYRRVREDNSAMNTPLRVFVETTVSAAVSQDQLTKRGIAALAFVMAMNNIRPVELYCVTIGRPDYGSYQAAGAICRVASRPVDLQRACFMLTDAAYARRLSFSSMSQLAGVRSYYSHVGWAWGSEPRSDSYQSRMRALLEAKSDDVIIFGGYILDKLMLNDPIAWVKQMLAKHNAARE